MNPPTPPPSQPESHLLSGIDQAMSQVKWRHLITKSASFGLLAFGIFSLIKETRLILFVYPKIPQYYQALNFDPSVYRKLLATALISSLTGLVDAVYGTMILFKPGHLVKNFHIVAAFLLFGLSLYLSLIGDELRPQEILNTANQLTWLRF